MNSTGRALRLWCAVAAVCAAGIGALGQLWLSQRGSAPLYPPLSYAATLIVLAVVVTALGARLRRSLRHDTRRMINPFHAVRVLAAARAAQLLGALSGGLASGIILQALTRTVPPGTQAWVTLVALFVSGIALGVCGIIVERWCQVPPGEHDDQTRAESPGELPADGEASA